MSTVVDSELPSALPAGVGWREEEKHRRRCRMLQSATVVFAERGFHQATVRDIAELSGFGKGTLYNYFEGGKEELLCVVLKSITRECVDATEDARQSIPQQDSLRSVFRRYFEDIATFFHTHPVSFRVIYECQGRSMLARFQEATRSRKGIAPQLHLDLAERMEDALAQTGGAFDESKHLPARRAMIFGHGMLSSYLRCEATYPDVLPETNKEWEEVDWERACTKIGELTLALPSGISPRGLGETVTEILFP